jgi:hypothetical protein
MGAQAPRFPRTRTIPRVMLSERSFPRWWMVGSYAAVGLRRCCPGVARESGRNQSQDICVGERDRTNNLGCCFSATCSLLDVHFYVLNHQGCKIDVCGLSGAFKMIGVEHLFVSVLPASRYKERVKYSATVARNSELTRWYPESDNKLPSGNLSPSMSR